MKREDLSGEDLLQITEDLAQASADFLVIDLEVIATLIDISRHRLSRNQRESAARSIESAKQGIESVRRIVSGSYLLNDKLEASISERCNELERSATELSDRLTRAWLRDSYR